MDVFALESFESCFAFFGPCPQAYFIHMYAHFYWPFKQAIACWTVSLVFKVPKCMNTSKSEYSLKSPR